jgi:hypothetical protein
MDQALQIGLLFVGGLVLSPVLIVLLKWYAPGDPFAFEDPETKEVAPAPPLPETVSPGLRRRKAAKAVQTEQVDPPAQSAPMAVEAQLRLQEAVLDRAETVAPVDEFGVNNPDGVDPFALSDTEIRQLENMTRSLLPGRSEEEIQKEIASAIDLAREEYAQSGGKSLEQSRSSEGWSSRTVARCLDLVFVIGIVIAIVYVMHREYGFQPAEMFRQVLPREAAVLEGRSHTGGRFGTWIASLLGLQEGLVLDDPAVE